MLCIMHFPYNMNFHNNFQIERGTKPFQDHYTYYKTDLIGGSKNKVSALPYLSMSKVTHVICILNNL